MRTKLLAVAAISLFLICAVACQPPASQSPAPRSPRESTCDRACLEKYVDQYMDAMLTHEPNPALFAKTAGSPKTGRAAATWRGPLGQHGRQKEPINSMFLTLKPSRWPSSGLPVKKRRRPEKGIPSRSRSA